jgi:hypothetical protein
MKTLLLALACLATLTSFSSSSSSAQAPAAPKLEFPDASPAAKLQQRVGVTDVEIAYARPSVKGRKIFGGLVPLGQVWRTGANSATQITFSTGVKLGGADVPAGTYALFSIPGAAEWTVILNKVPGQWGAYKYDEKNDLVRIKATPIELAEPVESLAFGFANLRADSATLYFEWEKTRVPLQLETNLVATMVPKIEAAMQAEGSRPYFAAAMFYYEHDLDLKKAAAWIDEAIKEQPDGFWITYRKGLILAKLGDKQGAIDAANKSLELASKAGGAIKDEYTRLNQELLARLK